MNNQNRVGLLIFGLQTILEHTQAISSSFNAIGFIPLKTFIDTKFYKAIGISENFREINPGEEVPFYEIVVEGEGNITLKEAVLERDGDNKNIGVN